MRVIAGTARSMPLKCIDGLETRPTTDRIKETLFNMLQSEVPGSRFLDLSGSLRGQRSHRHRSLKPGRGVCGLCREQ